MESGICWGEHRAQGGGLFYSPPQVLPLRRAHLKWPHLQVHTHKLKGFGPGADLPASVEAPQEGITEDVHQHGQGVHGGAVERQVVLVRLWAKQYQ